MFDTKYLTIYSIVEGQKEFVIFAKDGNPTNISEQLLILKYVSLKAQATREFYMYIKFSKLK